MSILTWLSSRLSLQDHLVPPARPVIRRSSVTVESHETAEVSERTHILEINTRGEAYESVEILRVEGSGGEPLRILGTLARAVDATDKVPVVVPAGETVSVVARIRSPKGLLSEFSDVWTLEPHQQDVLLARRRHFQKILDRIEYPSFTFTCHLSGEALYLQISCAGRCNVTGGDLDWKSGKWLLSEHMLDSEIVQKALKATLTALEHEARELFKYRGRAIFDPHYDLERLWELRGEAGAVVQREPPPARKDSFLMDKLHEMSGLPSLEGIARLTLPQLYELESQIAPRAEDCDNPGAIALVTHRGVQDQIRRLGGVPQFDKNGRHLG